MTTKARATIKDLERIPENGKAELVGGKIVRIMPTGDKPNRAVGAIYVSLRMYEKLGGGGRAYSDNAGFLVRLPNRESFSPDAAWYEGPSTGMRFLAGAPAFAVEVRSENDYSVKAEQDLAEKRRDYFAAGTRVVWDVDLLSKDVVKVYRYTDPGNPIIYRRGDLAEAEPAVPGWRMPADDLFG